MGRYVQIVSTGKYLPEKIVSSEELDGKLGVPRGWSYEHSLVKTRRYVAEETASEMGALAAEEALKKAGLSIGDIDCIVSVSGTMEQAIPCNAALIHRRLTGGADRFPPLTSTPPVSVSSRGWISFPTRSRRDSTAAFFSWPAKLPPSD